MSSTGSEDHSKTAASSGLATSTRSCLSMLRVWWPEFTACFAGVGIIGIIAGVLARFSNEQLDKWQSAITLNAILSVLVTVLYFLLMVTIAKCISQLKWNYFVHRQPLSDIELFDKASRSPWGSLVFISKSLSITKHSQRVLACLAAFLTISVAAIGPFVQQILSQEPSPVPVGHAELPIFNWTSSNAYPTRTVSDGGGTEQQTGSQGNLGVEAASMGLFAHNVQKFDIQSTCNNANCSWDPFWTFMVESECQNITNLLEVVTMNTSTAEDDIHWRLPNGFYASKMESPLATYFNLTGDFPSIQFNDTGFVLANFFVVTGNKTGWGSANVPLAMECILRLAGHRIQADYKNGVYSETKLGSSLYNKTHEALVYSPWRLRLAGRGISAGAIDLSGNLALQPSSSHVLLDVAIQDMDLGANLYFPGFYMLTVVDGLMDMLKMVKPFESRNFTDLKYAYSAGQAFVNLLAPAMGRSLTFQDRVDNIAKSLSAGMRSYVWPSQVVVHTTAYRDTIIYRVTWAWISLPASLVVLAFLLLALTVIDTHKKSLQKWSDSSLALITFSADEKLRQKFNACGDLASVEQLAKKVFANVSSDNKLTC
ncbi:hypothetical protein HII31_06394 [Pseudocercospora fuligena]|uniref:Uncharacterized protein n=1 Tax=Pseudocercospora fuligena TaxID=685502 RepID=A0A8H6RK59_9PEZI|nr:hypothetical protein HII31_06394 [Pseudocercospora fuligena]